MRTSCDRTTPKGQQDNMRGAPQEENKRRSGRRGQEPQEKDKTTTGGVKKDNKKAIEEHEKDRTEKKVTRGERRTSGHGSPARPDTLVSFIFLPQKKKRTTGGQGQDSASRVVVLLVPHCLTA